MEDHCKALDVVLQKGKFGEVYNVGGNCELQNIELTHKVLKALGKGEEMIELVKDRPGHDRRYSLNSSKLEVLGWKTETSFEEGLKKTIEWYKKNEAWWKQLIKS